MEEETSDRDCFCCCTEGGKKRWMLPGAPFTVNIEPNAMTPTPATIPPPTKPRVISEEVPKVPIASKMLRMTTATPIIFIALPATSRAGSGCFFVLLDCCDERASMSLEVESG